MHDDESVLAYCDERFAEGWRHANVFDALRGGFIDAMALFEFERTGVAHLLLKGPGFDKLFGMSADGDPANFIIRANRQDRENLLSACRTCAMHGSPIHVDVEWGVGQGMYAESKENYFRTVTSVEHVGHRDNSKILYFAFSDVSERRTRERTLTRSRFSSSLRALFDEIFLLSLDTGTSEPIYAGGRPLVKQDGTPIDCGFHAMFNTVHRDDSQMFWKYSNYTHVERELFGEEAKDAITFDLRRCDETGDYHWTRIYISRVPSGDSRKVVLVCSQNIDEQKEAQRRERDLLSKAQTDALSGLYNHGTSEELIRTRLLGLKDCDAAAFAIVDVDDFKRVNDTYGHSTGDALLKAVSSGIRAVCREGDIAGRMGGDEFVVLFSGDEATDEAWLHKHWLRCKEQVCDASHNLGIDPPVTLSIGVVEITGGGAIYNEVFEQADYLLYEAKRSGKDALRFAKVEI